MENDIISNIEEDFRNYGFPFQFTYACFCFFPMVHNAYQSDLQLSVPITTYIVSSILDQGEVYNIMW
jgi:hypothetical protein